MGIEDVADMLLNRIEGIRNTDQEQSRPLIFVAHSLGGIIVKKVWKADLLTQKTIIDSQVGGRQSFEQFGQLGWGTNTNFVEALKRNSPTFSDISRQFVERADPLTIRTFFETERWANQVVSVSFYDIYISNYCVDRGQGLSCIEPAKRDSYASTTSESFNDLQI